MTSGRYPGLLCTCIDCGGPCRRPDSRCRACMVRDATARAHVNVPDRFWPQVDKSGECWVWTGGLDGYGYGRFPLDQHGLKAHRVAYELVVGPIPDGLQLDHLCRNRACVNPAHLEPVTANENKYRGRRPTCRRGHDAWVARGAGRRCSECDRMHAKHRWAVRRQQRAAA